jgi:hypothetical protein
MQKNKESLRFYQNELLYAKQELFNAKSVKNLKNIQERIKFLGGRIDELEHKNF